jgi:hypothetical protein
MQILKDTSLVKSPKFPESYSIAHFHMAWNLGEDRIFPKLIPVEDEA